VRGQPSNVGFKIARGPEQLKKEKTMHIWGCDACNPLYSDPYVHVDNYCLIFRNACILNIGIQKADRYTRS
jgi:hypothetical protein